MKFDDILTTVGQFGRYQIWVYAFFFMLVIPNTFHAISIVFLAGYADHWCAEPEWAGNNCSTWGLDEAACTAAKRAAIIPIAKGTDDEFEKCSMYNVSGMLFSPEVNGLSDVDNHSLDVVPCQDGWTHDRSRYSSTINMEFELVCGNKDLSDISSSLWFVGILLGSLIYGFVADRVGRRITLWIALAGQLVSGVAVAFAPSFWWFAILRAILAINNYGVFLVAFIVGTEFVGPSKRVLAGTGIEIAFSIGYMFLSLVAFLIRDWRKLQIAISVPVTIFFIFIPLIPESARWLLSVGRVDEASKIITKLAKTNGAKLPEPVFTESEQMEMEKERGVKKPTVLDLFRTPNLRMESFNLLFNWMVESLVYYGLSLSSSDFGVNVYIAAFVSGAVEMPAYISSIFALQYFGRRISTCAYLLLGGVACFLTIFIPAGAGRAAMAMVGKFGITASFSIIYIYTAELYPTPLRSIGVGMCSMSSRIGGIIAPLIRISGRTWAPLPAIIYSLVSIAAGLLALLLPETKGRKLPETVEEGENLRNVAIDQNYEGVPDVEENRETMPEEAIPMATSNGNASDVKV